MKFTEKYVRLEDVMEILDYQCYGCTGEENPCICEKCNVKNLKHKMSCLNAICVEKEENIYD